MPKITLTPFHDRLGMSSDVVVISKLLLKEINDLREQLELEPKTWESFCSQLSKSMKNGGE